MGIVVSLACFAFVSYITVGSEADASSAEKMHLLSENAREELDNYLDSIEQAVEMCAHFANASLDGVALVECGAKNPPDQRTAAQTERLDELIHTYSNQVQEAFGSVATHTNGIVTYYYCINPDISVTEHGFFYSKIGKVGFEMREPLDARELDPDDTKHTVWYYTPITRGIPSWVGPYTAHFLGEVYCVSYLTPIYKSGILIGVMGMDILFDTLVEHIENLKVYDTGYACLLDRDWRILYDPTRAMGETADYSDRLQSTGSARGESSGDTIIRYMHDGVEWQLAYSTLSSGMRLVVCAPVSEVVRSWQRLVFTMPMVAIILLVVFGVGAFVAMRNVSAPLQQLTLAARKLSEGDYDVQLDYNKQDEVGELTSAIRGLRDHLQIYIIDLNNQEYLDERVGVKNLRALNIYCARLDDTIGHEDERDELEFAFVRIDIKEMESLRSSYGNEAADEGVKSTCEFICRVYSKSPVFYVDDGAFVVLLQGVDYANRDEKLLDFSVRSKRYNMRNEEPWKKINVLMGMSTFRPDVDQSAEIVLRRARDRLK